jgi:hypothetical protein
MRQVKGKNKYRKVEKKCKMGAWSERIYYHRTKFLSYCLTRLELPEGGTVLKGLAAWYYKFFKVNLQLLIGIWSSYA